MNTKPANISSTNNNNLRIATLFFLMLCIGLYVYTSEQKDYYDAHAKPAAEQMITALSHWQKSTLLEHLSEQAKQTLSDQQLNKLLDHYRQFGQLEQLKELQFSRLASALSLFGQRHINYQADAIFSNSHAHINLTLIAHGNSYKIYNFTISKNN